MKTKIESEKTDVLESLLNEARQEADALRHRLQKFEQIILSTRLIMGHELKKPATAISGYLDLVLEEEDAVLDPETKRLVEKARAECELLNELNLFFLELLKVDDRKEKRHGGRYDLRAVAQEVLSHFPEPLEARRRVKVRIPTKVKDFHMNPNAVKIILSNVIENALHYSQPDTDVQVEISKSPDKRGMQGRELLKIVVSDRGVGIPQEYLKKIFSPFVRLHEDLADGTGLGLTLVRSLVELYDGDVYIRSEDNQGTAVHVTIPELAEDEEHGAGP